jgi:hypothetical protein
MRYLPIALVPVLALALVGCGGSSADPSSEIRSNTKQIYDAVKDDNIGKLCTYYTDRLACASSFATARAFLGDVKLGDLLTDKEFAKAESEIDSMKVQVSKDGKTAWSRMKGEDSDTWVLHDGEWKLDWEQDES